MKRLRRRWLCSKVALFAAIVGLECCFRTTSYAAKEGWRVEERNQDIMLKYLRPALRSAGGIGRLDYATNCYKDSVPVPFPKLKMRSVVGDQKGLAAVRSIFRDDERVSVVQNRSGMVRITIGRPMSAILQTKIRSLTLKPLERYNPGLAIIAIETSKEVEAAAKSLGLELPLVVTDMNVAQPAKGLPHLPALLENSSVEQALDLVAKTFGGIAYYGVCANSAGKRLFYFDYFGVAGTEEEYGH